MLSLSAASLAFSAPGAHMVSRPALDVSMTAIRPGDIGTTKPLGVYDPLNLMTSMPDKYRRWQEMEIKHGRMSMLACAHVFVVGAGFKFPGYISYLSFPPLKFDDIPAGTLGKQQPAPNSLAAAA